MTDYIIIILLAILIIITGYYSFIFFKYKNTNGNESKADQRDANNELKLYFQKEYGDLKFEMGKLFSESNKTSLTDLNAFKDHMMQHIDTQMKQINDKVESRLGKGFEETNKTFINVIERLSKIDEAQKKIETLSTEVVSLNDLLTDKKTRGIFGEVQLYQLLSAILGENKGLYEKQKLMSNGNIADAVVHAPEPLGTIAIDSKFPLDNYKRMVDRSLGDADRKTATKDFKNDVKKHINDISSKYIILNETADQAFMFVPAEAIFAEITAYHEDLIEYAMKNKVWMASPTTLISTLSMIQMVVKNIQRDEQAKVIIQELIKLGDEFRRYSERWDKLKKSIESVSKTAEQVHITSTKINSKFKHISEAKFEEIDEGELEDDQDETIEELD
ncbi:MAG: DNA recombination protein RmuC [Acholeplasmataceae bacterium]|nr:DNA recombination protein RmuC [Acholeplasmataceae bacterium]